MGKLFKYMKNYWAGTLIVFVLLIVQAYCDLSLPNYTADILDTGIMQGGVENVCPEFVSKETMDDLMLFMTDDEKQEVEDNYVLKDSIKDCDVKTEDKTSDSSVYMLNTKKSDTIDKLDDDFGMAVVTYSAISQMSSKAESSSKDEMTDDQKKQAEEFQKLIQENIAKNTKDNMPDTSKMTKEQIAEMQKKQQEAQKEQSMDMMALIRSGQLDASVLRDYFADKYSDMSDMAVPQSAKAFWKTEYGNIGIDMNSFQKSYLYYQGGKMLAMAALIMVCTIIICYLAAKIGAGIGKDLRVGVFKKVVSFSNEEMDKFSTSSLITRSTNDIQQIQMVITMMLRMCLYAPILGVGGVIKVLNTNTSMVWTIGVAVAAVIVAVMILMSVAMPKFKIMQNKVDKLNLVTREIITGLPVIRAFSREKHEEERFDVTNKDLTKTMLFTNRVMTFMMPVMMLIMNATTVLIVWVASKQIDLGKLQVGSMTAFITYAMMIIMSFLMLSMISVMLPRAAVAAQRVDEILTTEPVIKDKDDASADKKIQKGIVKFDHVNFKYANADTDVLNDISFTAEPGKTTAIIGSTGSGKSTLVHLITRFYDVESGSVSIDGTDVRDYTQNNLHDAIGFVPQKAVLFSGDIKSNLSFGCQDAPMEQLVKAAEVAQATEFIDAKPDGYDSAISQGGTNVSGGQKQRLSIARAIAKKPKILIFDDSFSALDFKTDVKLRKALHENSGDSTVIIVAQRIVTIQNADNIIVLDEGRIAGQGTHNELLRNCEVYDQIVKSQLSEAEYEAQLAQANAEVTGKGDI